MENVRSGRKGGSREGQGREGRKRKVVTICVEMETEMRSHWGKVKEKRKKWKKGKGNDIGNKR